MTPMERIEGELSDAQKRIAELEYLLERQAKAAQQGMDAAKKVASSELEQAKRLHAECNPWALESERAANAVLTEQIAKLEAHIASLKDDIEIHRVAEETQIALRERVQEERDALASQVERLDNELQGKALTDDGVLADAYWNCADMITPWLGEKTGPDTLINSVCGSLEFLIQQWREKKTLEQGRDKRDLIKQAEALEHHADCVMEIAGYLESFRREVAGLLRADASSLRHRAQELVP